MKSLSRVQLLATPWTAAHQAPPSMGFSRQEYWSGVPLPSPISELVQLKTVLFEGQLYNQPPPPKLSTLVHRNLRDMPLGRRLAEPLPGAKGCTSYLSIFLSTLNPLGQYKPVQATHQIRMRQFFSEDPHGPLENVSYNCCTNRNQNATSVLKAFPKFSPNSYIF